MARKNKPYATMADGPDAYLFRKDGTQKLVGSADNEVECPQCEGSGIWTMAGNRKTECPQCDGEGYLEELEEDDTEGYQYRTYTDYEEDNSKIWHEGKAPGGDWEIIDRSPYAPMDKFAWDLYVDFHKENGRWPNQQESRKIEDLEYEVMTKMNEELNEIRELAGLPPVAEDCDETPGEDKNDDGDCSPFTHADENVDMVKEEELDEDFFDEDFLAPKKDAEDTYDTDEGDVVMGEPGVGRWFDATDLGDDAEAFDRVEPELDRQTNFDAPSRYDGDDSFDFMDEQGPGDEFDHDEDAMVDVGDDDEFGDYDFESELDDMMGNTSRFESVAEQIVAMNEIRKAAGLAEAEVVNEEVDSEDIIRAFKQRVAKGDKVGKQLGDALNRIAASGGEDEDAMDTVFMLSSKALPGVDSGSDAFADAIFMFGESVEEEVEEGCDEACEEEAVEESAPHGSDDYDFFDFKDDKAYFLVADEIGDRIIFGMSNEVGVPEQYTDGIIDLLRQHGFEKGIDFDMSFANQHIQGEPLEDDLQNGYGEHEYADSYDDYFPRGSHQSPSNDLGPTASGYGDNAMQNKMRSKETDRVYEGMRQKYRRYRLS